MPFLGLTSDQRRLLLYSRFEDKELAKKIPEASWDKVHRAWTYPFTPDHVDAIRSVFPDVGMDAGIAIRAQHLRDRLVKIEAIKRGDLSVMNGIDWTTLTKTPLRDYHKLDVLFALTMERVMLSAEMGLGKSIEALTL